MKNIYAILFILLTGSLNAQTNFLPADSTVIWTGVTTTYTGGPQGVYNYWTQFGIDSTENDTLINSQYYTKLNYFIDVDSSTYTCGFRSDTINQTLYFLPKDSTNEYLFFDYSIEYELGDTVFIPHYESGQSLGFQYYKLNSIDSNFIDNNYFKNYKFYLLNISDSLTSEQNYNSTEFIDIAERTITGRSFPFHGSGNISVTMELSLSCYQENGNFKYSPVNFVTCPLLPDNYLFSSTGEQEQLNELKIYPNPSSGIFSIELSFLDESVVTVYDLNGKIINQIIINSKFTSLNLSHLKTGIYILELETLDQLLQEKIIIE